jgi:sugar lactone lactonase YvrE
VDRCPERFDRALIAVALLSGLAPIAAVLDRPHGLLEAPRLGSDGEIVYSDVLAGGFFALAPDGFVAALVPKRRGIGGAVAHADGGWVISGRSLLHVSPDGSQRELLGDGATAGLDGEALCGFNDLGATPDGDLLAGVLRYRPLAGEPERNGQLVRIDAHGHVDVLTDEVIWPNGIGVAPDGDTIYISDYARASVLALDRRGGAVREFCRSPRGSADGLAVDADGGVWFALGEGGGLARFGADGRLDEIVELPAQFVSSLCFCGADMRDVLITTADNQIRPQLGGALFRARSAVAGLALRPVAV